MLIKYNEERDLKQLLIEALNHDGEGYRNYIEGVVKLPSNVLLVEYEEDKLRAWVGTHDSVRGDYIHLYATSIDNHHTYSVWREIFRVIKKRNKPMVTGITSNFEKLKRLVLNLGAEWNEEYKSAYFR